MTKSAIVLLAALLAWSGATAQKPNLTDVMKVAMTCYLGDSVYFDFQQTESQVYAQLKESVFPADLNEAYSMMNLGDSASFYI